MKTLARDDDHAELVRRLRSVRHDSARLWGRMSAHQMVCHLSDGYRLLTGERTANRVTLVVPRQMIKFVALYAPLPWPRGLPTTPELDQTIGGTRPADFAADVAALELLLSRITTDERARLADYAHPLFGSMSEAAWLRWAYLHADHHLRQFGA